MQCRVSPRKMQSGYRTTEPTSTKTSNSQLIHMGNSCSRAIDREIRVAQCIHGLGLGGAQQIVASIVRDPRGKPFRYFVYSSLGGVRKNEIESPEVAVRVLPRMIPKLDPVWVARLRTAFESDRIDVVQTHLFGDSLHAYLAARLGNLPVVMTLHNRAESFSRMQQVGYRWLIPRCFRVVSCSESVRQTFQTTGWPGVERIVAIPNGIQTNARTVSDQAVAEIRSQLGIAPETTTIAAIGRLVEQKGYKYLIEAMRLLTEVSQSRTRLLIIGEGPYRERLQAQIHVAGLGEHVIITGYRSDIPALLEIVDIVVFSSLWEGLPIALLEVMAAARCIVATRIPSITEAVRESREALLVPPANAGQLAQALELAIAQPDLRRRLGQAARARFQTQFTAERMIARYEEIYAQAAAVGRTH